MNLLLRPQIIAVAVAAALITAMSVALYVQTQRLKAVRAEYAAFVAETRAEGERAAAENARIEAQYKHSQEVANAEYQKSIAAMRTTVDRLRAQRAAGGFLPAPAPGAGRPETACFDRPLLERALRDLDQGVQELVDEGSEAVIGLDTAKTWASGLQGKN